MIICQGISSFIAGYWTWHISDQILHIAGTPHPRCGVQIVSFGVIPSSPMWRRPRNIPSNSTRYEDNELMFASRKQAWLVHRRQLRWAGACSYLFLKVQWSVTRTRCSASGLHIVFSWPAGIFRITQDANFTKPLHFQHYSQSLLLPTFRLPSPEIR